MPFKLTKDKLYLTINDSFLSNYLKIKSKIKHFKE